MRTLGTVESARNWRIQVCGASARAAFNLRQATFAHYLTPMYPRWPMGPAAAVMALHVFLDGGEWLMLAEALRRDVLPARRRAIEG